MLNPFAIVGQAFYRLYKSAILAAYARAESDAHAIIQAKLPTIEDFQEVGQALDEASEEPPMLLAITDKPRKKK